MTFLGVFIIMREYVRDYAGIEGAKKGEGESFIKELPEDFIEICTQLFITKSEFVDFSDLDMCAFPNLRIVNLYKTPNNFKEQDYPCFEKFGDFELYQRVRY